MYINTIQYAIELSKDKPKIVKARKAQAEIEKNGKWVRVEDDFKPYYKFVKNK